MPLLFRNSPYSQVTALAARRAVHVAFSWLHNNPKTIMDWHREVVAIPAPPFGEHARAEWFVARFKEAGLQYVEIDEVGNVLATRPAASLPPESTGPVVLLSAHLDTVFPADTPLHPRLDNDRLAAPGASDNGAGLAGMLAIAHALTKADVILPAPLIFLANVGEEGEGNLRGVRHLYQQNSLAGRIAAHIVLDGAGSDAVVTQALGSKRFRVTITGPGGHSFTDAGTPNPIVALASALTSLIESSQPKVSHTTMNVGTIRGGKSVNSIPEKAHATLDFRSTEPNELIRMEVALHRAVEDAVERTNQAIHHTESANRGPLDFAIEKIGDRPAAELSEDSALLTTLRAVDRHLGVRTDLRLGSTDANIPLSLGVQALSMGAGGEGGAAHTTAEWFCARNRELGLRRVLLLTLAMLQWAAER